MTTPNLRQSRLDIERLRMAADRLDELETAHRLALGDLRIARQGLQIIATWANCFDTRNIEKEFSDIHDRAMDTLSLMLTGKNDN